VAVVVDGERLDDLGDRLFFAPLLRGPRFRQFGRTSAPMVPHFVHTILGPNDGTVTSPGRWSTFMITSCRQW
jgi:hypothetical protein